MTASSNNLIRWLAVALALALLVLAVVLPRDFNDEPLQVAIGVWPGVETLVVGRERGLLSPERVRMIDMVWPSAAMRAFGNQVVDAAVLSLDEVVRLREAGYDLRVVMVMDVSLGADVVVGEGGMQGVADLRGKRVGVDIRSSGMVLLESALASVGMSGGDLDAVPLSPSELAGAMTEGRIDAAVAAEPWATRILRQGGKVLFDSRQLKQPLYRVLVASAQAVKERRADLQIVMKAHLLMSKAEVLASDASVRDVVLRREQVSFEEFKQSLDRVTLVNRERSMRLMLANGELAAHADALQLWMLEAGLIEGQIGSASWLDRSLLEGLP